jgi:hypothetical protein
MESCSEHFYQGLSKLSSLRKSEKKLEETKDLKKKLFESCVNKAIEELNFPVFQEVITFFSEQLLSKDDIHFIFQKVTKSQNRENGENRDIEEKKRTKFLVLTYEEIVSTTTLLKFFTECLIVYGQSDSFFSFYRCHDDNNGDAHSESSREEMMKNFKRIIFRDGDISSIIGKYNDKKMQSLFKDLINKHFVIEGFADNPTISHAEIETYFLENKLEMENEIKKSWKNISYLLRKPWKSLQTFQLIYDHVRWSYADVMMHYFEGDLKSNAHVQTNLEIVEWLLTVPKQHSGKGLTSTTPLVVVDDFFSGCGSEFWTEPCQLPVLQLLLSKIKSNQKGADVNRLQVIFIQNKDGENNSVDQTIRLLARKDSNFGRIRNLAPDFEKMIIAAKEKLSTISENLLLYFPKEIVNLVLLTF